jgi:hypothetical protein
MATAVSPPKHRALVTFVTLADGSVEIVATGRNGSLTLRVDGGEDGPSMDIPLLDHERTPGKPWRYKAVWGLEANGKLKGWVAEDNGKIKWFEAPSRKVRKQPVRQGKVKRSARKEG